MSEIQKNKESITSDLSRISRGIVEARKRYESAKASGNDTEAQSYFDMATMLNEKAGVLQNQYSDIVEEEKKPKVEEIKRLRTELAEKPKPNWGRGAILESAGGVSFPSQQKVEERQREIAGKLFNAPVSEAGVAAEQLPAGVRFGLGALATPESELQYLKQTYPDFNITPMNVGGKTEYLLKDQGNKVLTTLDRGVAGAVGSGIIEVPLTAAEIGATVGTLGLTKSPVMAEGAAAATRLAGGTLADMITKTALGMPRDIGESMMRRGTEAAIGAAIGIGADVIPAATIAPRLKNPYENTFLRELQGSAERLGIPVSRIPGSQFGPQGVRVAQELGGEFPGSRIANALRLNQETAGDIFRAYKSGVPVTPNDFIGIAQSMKSQRDALKETIKQATGANERVIEGAFDRILTPRRVANIDNFGEFLQGTIQKAESEAGRVRDEQYDILRNIAKRADFEVPVQFMIDRLPAIKRELNASGFVDDSAIKRVEERLQTRKQAPVLIYDLDKQVRSLRKQRQAEKKPIEQERLSNEIDVINKQISSLKAINRPLDFDDFDSLIKEFHNARPADGNAVGKGTKDFFGLGISKGLSDLRQKMYDDVTSVDDLGNPVNLGAEFRKAAQFVEERAAYEKDSLGFILKEAAGDQGTTARQAVNAIMTDPAKMNRVLKSASNLEATDPTQVGVTDQLRDMMQVQYLDNIGMGAGRGTTKINYDMGILTELYGSQAPRVARGFESMNDQLKKLGNAKVPSMTLTDLYELSSALSKTEREAVAKNIIKRRETEAAEEALVSSEIFQQAKRGDFKNIDPDALSAVILAEGTTPRDVQIIMAQLNKMFPSSRNLYNNDFRRSLLDRYKGGEPTSGPPFEPLFDTEKYIQDYNPNTGITELGKKINIVLGDTEGGTLLDIARVYESSKLPQIGAKPIAPRMIASKEGINAVIPLAQVAGPIRRRYIAALLGTGTNMAMLRDSLVKNALPGNTNELYKKMMKNLFMTRQGVTALAHQASSDPEFSAELVRAAREFEQKEGANANAAMEAEVNDFNQKESLRLPQR
jgi:hypothetical protein